MFIVNSGVPQGSILNPMLNVLDDVTAGAVEDEAVAVVYDLTSEYSIL